MTETKFKVGDPAVITGVNMRNAQKVTIKSVGRKYVTAEGWPGVKFDFDGCEAGAFRHHSLRTVEEWEESQRYGELMDALKAMGVKFDWQSRRLSNVTLSLIVDVVRAEVEL